MNQNNFRTYLVSYNHDGSEWNIELPATSQQDAENRLWALRSGRVEGELAAKIPVQAGWLVRAFVAITGLFR